MSMCVLGMAAEFADDGIAFNALWPRTGIATAAIRNALAGDEGMKHCRTPEILSDAAYMIFDKKAREFSGNFLIDDTFMAANGVRDFDQYQRRSEQGAYAGFLRARFDAAARRRHSAAAFRLIGSASPRRRLVHQEHIHIRQGGGGVGKFHGSMRHGVLGDVMRKRVWLCGVALIAGLGGAQAASVPECAGPVEIADASIARVERTNDVLVLRDGRGHPSGRHPLPARQPGPRARRRRRPGLRRGQCAGERASSLRHRGAAQGGPLRPRARPGVRRRLAAGGAAARGPGARRHRSGPQRMRRRALCRRRRGTRRLARAVGAAGLLPCARPTLSPPTPARSRSCRARYSASR